MNRELRELLNKINAKKTEIKNMIANDDLDGAKAAKKELDKLQSKFDLLSEVADNDDGNVQNNIVNGAATPATRTPFVKDMKKLTRAFGNILKNTVRGKKANEKDLEVVKLHNEMNEGDPDTDGTSNGILTVPQDIRTEIMELKRTSDDLEQYVNVEPTSTLTGSRVIEVNADTTAYPDVDEGETYGEEDTPKERLIEYKIKKRGGIHKITQELLKDTAENLMGYLNKWIAKKTRATRNKHILTKLDEITKNKEVPITDIDGLKDIFNIKLDPAIKVSSRIITNQDGFNYLDKLKDADGRYLLQPNPTDKTKKMLFGEYEVVSISNKILKSVEETITSGEGASATTQTVLKITMYCGDTKEAITLFDREKMTIEANPFGDGWNQDKVPVKVRDRFDVVSVDEDAVVKAEITVDVVG